MGIFKGAAVVGLAKRAATEARKPHNQAKIKSAVAKVKQRRAGGTPPRP